VRSIARYIAEPKKMDFEARLKKKSKKNKPHFAV